MVEKSSDIYGESYFPVQIGQGIYSSELPSNIPEGFSEKAFNLVATGDSLENRIGIRQSSVDWHVTQAGRILDDSCLIQRVGNAGNAELAWASEIGGVHRLHLIKASTVVAGDGYMEINMTNQVRGITSYGGTVYFLMEDANHVYKISTYNWTADSITFASIPSALGIPATTGLYSFKDRLWTAFNNRIYFTDVAGLGVGPETWAATNYIQFDCGKGKATIQRIVTLSNKVLVFTSAGVFSLLVEGEPSSWIVKVLDSESISTSRQCAFEAKGIVYYVNTQGVWATNGQSIAKLSGVIEDQFFLAKGTRFHTLHSYEDGIVLCISKMFDNGSYDPPNCRIFYSKLDPVGWTEWNIDNGDGTTNTFGANRIVDIHSISSKVPTFLNQEPTVFLIASVCDATESVAQNCRAQLLVFDGGENQMRNRAGDLIAQPVSCVLKTKYMDAGNPYRNKTNKYGLLELYTSDSMHSFKTAWDIDATTGAATTVRDSVSSEFTVGLASNLIRIPADFKFRRCSLTLTTALQSNTSQIKIKDLAICLAVDRDEQEVVR